MHPRLVSFSRTTSKYTSKYRSLLHFQSQNSAFSTLEFAPKPQTSIGLIKSTIDEFNVLNQLSDLFHIPIASNSPPNQPEIRAVDGFLSPEEKLRGVFLQKLLGKSSIHRALSCVDVELDMEVFARVVNRGDLCGESMVVFFNWAIQQPNIQKNVSTYHVILKALGRRKFFEHMMQMLNEMKGEGISPNSETIYIVMDSYLCAGQVSKAMKVFKELENYGLKCDKETLIVALRSLCKRSHVRIASSLFDKTKEKVHPNSTMYNIIIGGWSRLGNVTEAEKFLKVMVDDEVEPDSETYSYLIEGLGRSGKVDGAVKILEFLEEKGDEIGTKVYNAMIFNFLACGDIDGALRYYKVILSNGCEPNMDTYIRIILYFLKKRRVADAIEFFDEMLGRGVIPSTGTLTLFLEPLCSYGPPYAALMFYRKAKKAGCRVSLTAYKLLLMRLSRFGKCNMVLNVWNDMQESKHSCDMQVYEYVVNGLCNNGQLESAVLIMEEALSKGFFPGKIICSKLNNKLMDSGKVEVAYKLFLKLRRARVEENAQRYWRAKGWHF